jgi:hypothetical protein
MTERKARAKTEAKADARGGGHSNAEIGLVMPKEHPKNEMA